MKLRSDLLLKTTIRQFTEIEFMFACHGRDTDALEKKAMELAKTTPMSFKEAVAEVLHEDQKTRQQPVGILGYKGEELK